MSFPAKDCYMHLDGINLMKPYTQPHFENESKWPALSKVDDSWLIIIVCSIVRAEH